MGKSARFRRSQTSSSENNPTDDVLTGKDSSDDPYSSDSDTESNLSSGTESNMSCDSATSTGLSAIIRVLSDSLLRTELAEMEMIKAREAARLEAEKRRLEMEVDLTQMVLQTHLQATTSLLVGEHKISPAQRKRKRSDVEELESSTTREKSLALLGLLQLNLIFWNSLT
ncbi:unnamed protein product [Arabidopsis lyrata]|nr:uncharacterized protein At4g22160 [Arabidopsis lyrata subsp. lyrata]CAH8275754.1 unnamed protein product [Arabidopsis lyrata]|eukprot:XP_020873777.1 uncharacterized protein At4g22160 [Arabidopsis lyrata subsp. lyrata]